MNAILMILFVFVSAFQGGGQKTEDASVLYLDLSKHARTSLPKYDLTRKAEETPLDIGSLFHLIVWI